jgi:hypothetical protein
MKGQSQGTAAAVSPSPADDTLEGVAEIAAYIGKTERQAVYMCEQRHIPAFKLGGKWHLRKSTYARHIARLEATAMGEVA